MTPQISADKYFHCKLQHSQLVGAFNFDITLHEGAHAPTKQHKFYFLTKRECSKFVLVAFCIALLCANRNNMSSIRFCIGQKYCMTTTTRWTLFNNGLKKLYVSFMVLRLFLTSYVYNCYGKLRPTLKKQNCFKIVFWHVARI